jgi:hypothetical protein
VGLQLEAEGLKGAGPTHFGALNFERRDPANDFVGEERL